MRAPLLANFTDRNQVDVPASFQSSSGFKLPPSSTCYCCKLRAIFSRTSFAPKKSFAQNQSISMTALASCHAKIVFRKAFCDQS